MSVQSALSAIPDGLRLPLLSEYQSIVQNFAEHRWSPSELSGGKFCEIVFTILDGYAKGIYSISPKKPRAFDQACKLLENNSQVPRSFQILIPRLLPALFEVRNNRGVGHAGGDVDPNHMDAVFVLSSCTWVMAELVRVFHNVSILDAQDIVDKLASGECHCFGSATVCGACSIPRWVCESKFCCCSAHRLAKSRPQN